MYGNDKCALIVLALMKQYGIRKIVLSPGFCNMHISASVAYDPFFEVYSVVDERSAAYFAVGLSEESGEPVVISCTGATSSRNYLPALTEAYYRHIPVIALTAQRRPTDSGNLLDQTLDRTISQSDIKMCSVILPSVKDKHDEETCILNVNKALLMATEKKGPVHIDIPINSWSFTTKLLPKIPKMECYTAEKFLLEDVTKALCNELYGKRVAVFIGAHRRFDSCTLDAVNRFTEKYGAVVFYDHTSNFHGENAVLAAVASELCVLKCKPEIVIDLGSVSGVSTSADILLVAECFWRISETGEFHCRYGKTNVKHFLMSEYCFFHTLSIQSAEVGLGSTYNSKVYAELSAVRIPELPFSNPYICQVLSNKLPHNCVLSLGIKNSLRSMDYFPLDSSIDVVSNVGGFGIDGTLSTIIGKSMVHPEKLYFSVLGDLAFFYDMNALGIHHIQRNLRILVVNNGCGVEMMLNRTVNWQMGSVANGFSTAMGHFGSVKAWVESMGFEYMSAKTKEELLVKADRFCDADLECYRKPVVFEVFVRAQDDQQAVAWIRAANKPCEFDLERIKEILKNRGSRDLIVLFGAGDYGQLVADKLTMQGIYPDYFSDNAVEKWGETLDGIEIVSPEELSEWKKDYNILVIITVGKQREEITAQLTEQGLTVLF